MKPTYSELISRSWNILKPQWPLAAALTFVMFLGFAALSKLQYLSYLGNVILTPGYIACMYRLSKGESFEFRDVFWSVMNFKRFLNLVFLVIATNFLIVLGFVFLLIPGIWLSVLFAFTTFLIVRDDKDAIEVMKTSRDVTNGRWWYVAGLMGVMLGLNFLGLLAFGVGVLISAPVSGLMMILALDSLQGKGSPADPTLATEPKSVSTFAVNS